jgi:hypothetical protein
MIWWDVLTFVKGWTIPYYISEKAGSSYGIDGCGDAGGVYEYQIFQLSQACYWIVLRALKPSPFNESSA